MRKEKTKRFLWNGSCLFNYDYKIELTKKYGLTTERNFMEILKNFAEVKENNLFYNEWEIFEKYTLLLHGILCIQVHSEFVSILQNSVFHNNFRQNW